MTKILRALVIGNLALLYACSSSDGKSGNQYGNNNNAGTGGSQANGGSGDTANGGSTSGGAAGMSGGTGGDNGGSQDTSGTGGDSGGSGGTAETGGTDAGTAGSGGEGGEGGALGSDLTAVVPSTACTTNATAPVGNGPFTIQTTGTKATDCADTNNGGDCGPAAWNYTRQYYIYLPTGYDHTKAYPLVFLGPGCGGHGDNIYPYSPSNLSVPGDSNVNNTIIRVGVTPSDGGPNGDGQGGGAPGAQHYHATNPDQGCFDDKEGDDSVDWVFYENLYDLLDTQLCFDKNRVFAGGDSSGAWFSNELGCKYAGDPQRPIRGIMPNTGGLPNQPAFEPTCTSNPLAGFWSHEINDNVNPFTGNKFAIARAMSVDSCTMGNSYDNATLVNFPIGNGRPDDTCKQIQGCNPLTPLVVCALNGGSHASHPDTVNPGVSTFLKLFSAPPLIQQ